MLLRLARYLLQTTGVQTFEHLTKRLIQSRILTSGISNSISHAKCFLETFAQPTYNQHTATTTPVPPIFKLAFQDSRISIMKYAKAK
jgi:hypothetical protein